ncbi:STAGA complex 65 subunit gamma [Armadillidium nasatum]|uniref:STAGA complex 65 subunit gamma n=1 Tax=Armadillidium nasatum TaxID=96803 RepID=A0A5N5SJU5_9CRUS|nr:STAGA complex 65 subunit gamma [Armadillidium nasatum]
MSFNLSSHWGEFEDPKRNEDWSLSLADIEEQILPSTPPPSLYQPSHEETASFQILPPEMCRSDPLVLHTIRLLQHQRQLLQLLTRAQTFGIDINASPSPFPDDPPVKRKPVKFHYLNFMPPNDTPFTIGPTKPQKYEIEGSTAKLILRKAVATLCAHAGYTDTTESVLKVLTDVAHDFLTKVTGVLRANKDSMMLTGNCPFHDVVEQTLQDMRLGGMSELHRMYRERVVNYHTRVRQRTLQLHHQYQTLLNQAGSSVLSQTLRRDSCTTTDLQSEENSLATGANSVISTTNNILSLTSFGNYSISVPSNNIEDASVLSNKSNSSAEPEGSLQSHSVLSQTGLEDEENTTTGQTIVFSVTR